MKVTIEINGQQYEVDLPDETAQALQEIAERNGLTMAAALQQAIVNEKFIEDQRAQGGKLLIENGNTLRELVRA